MLQGASCDLCCMVDAHRKNRDDLLAPVLQPELSLTGHGIGRCQRVYAETSDEVSPRHRSRWSADNDIGARASESVLYSEVVLDK
jgi:hypothetical protein